MVTDTMDFADEIHIFISNMSEKTMLNKNLSKSKFAKLHSFLSKSINEINDTNITSIISDILNTYLTIPYKEVKQKLDNLVNLTKNDIKFNEKLISLITSLNKDVLKEVRYSANGTSIDAETSEKIFNIFAKDYGIYDKVITHICNNPMPLISAVGFGNHQCKNCDIYIGSTTNDEASERDAGWTGLISKFKYNPTNRIHRLPIATKIQAARDIRKNINNLTKDMFPEKISNESFQKIKELLNPTNTINDGKSYKGIFYILCENIMKNLIFESGIAIHDIQPVKLENIQPTIKKLYNEILKPLGIKYESIVLLGSTGKKPVSGDLDIGLDVKTALSDSGLNDKFELAEKIENECKKYGYQFSNALNSQFKTVHIGIPIVNQDGIAQVDIMMSNNIEYAKFRFHSPTQNESKYKGAIRSDLLKAIFLECSKQIDKNASIEDQQEYIDKDGNKHDSIQYSQLSLDIDGILKTVKTHRGKKGGINSSARILSKNIIDETDVQKMIDILFYGLYKISDFNSFESIWNNVLFNENFPYKDKIDKIIKTFIDIINRDNSWQLEENKLKLPDEVIEYISNTTNSKFLKLYNTLIKDIKSN